MLPCASETVIIFHYIADNDPGLRRVQAVDQTLFNGHPAAAPNRIGVGVPSAQPRMHVPLRLSGGGMVDPFNTNDGRHHRASELTVGATPIQALRHASLHSDRQAIGLLVRRLASRLVSTPPLRRMRAEL